MLSEFDEGIVPSTAVDAGVSQGLEHLRIDPSVISVSDSTADMMSTIPGAFPNGRNVVSSTSAAKSVMRDGSRKAPLQRRSHVLSQAAEGDRPGLVPEPSWEMIQNATGQSSTGTGPGEASATTPTDSNTNDVVRGNKRAHSELTPLPEEYESDSKSTSPLGNSNSNTARKKGKTSDEDSAGGAGRGVAGGSTKAKGGKSKAKRAGGARNRANKEDEMSDDNAGASAVPATPAQKPRRSTRQTPQKAARRV
jgi:serine/threonine/tyrosine protein kinase RAD53